MTLSLARLALSALLISSVWTLGSASTARAVPVCGGGICTFTLGTSGWDIQVLESFVTGGLVDFVVDTETATTVEIEKSAEFLSNNTIPVTFVQTSASAVPTIIFNDIILKNTTGTDWIGFVEEILGSGDAVFDPVSTGTPCTGIGVPNPCIEIDPFTTAVFSNGNTKWEVSDGVVLDGNVWIAGVSPVNGMLFIDTILGQGTAQDPFTVFHLKETPVPVPEPSSLLLAALGIGGIALRRRL